MGEFASVIVAKSDELPGVLASYRTASFLLDDALADGWHVWAFDDVSFAQQHADAVAIIERSTEAPALVGQLIDSDVVLLTGKDEAAVWDVWIPMPTDPDMANGGPLTGTAAASTLRTWATAAGLRPDQGALELVTSNKDHEGFGGWTALRAVLAAFGLDPS